MALVGFPEFVQATLGIGWAPGAPHGLTPGQVLELQWNAPFAAYFENGTNIPNGVSNRLAIIPFNAAATFSLNAATISAANSPTATTWTFLGNSTAPTTSLADYTWNTVWTRLPSYYVLNGFRPGFTLGFMASWNACYQPEVFSSFDVSSEGNWWLAQQALLNLALFPNCIQVTLGTAWSLNKNGLGVGTVMQLHRVPGLSPPIWTEDATDVPNNTTNRLMYRPQGTPGSCIAYLSAGTTGPTTWAALGRRGVSAAGYTFHTIWDMTAGWGSSVWTTGLWLTPTTGMGTTGMLYNDEIFAAMDPCGGVAGGNSPDLFACQRAP